MKQLLLVIGLVCLIVPAAWALTGTYGWEDCGTVLGTYPATNPGLTCTNVTSPVHSGTHSLQLVRTNASTTTQAYVAWVTGLTNGDVVTGMFWAYDTTASGNPSVRIWAHYANSTDINSTFGSASGSADYSGSPVGWGTVPNISGYPYSWTFSTTTAADAIIIEVRSYGATAPLNTCYVDDLTITAPDRAGVHVIFPAPGPSATEPMTWGGIKALFQ